MYSSYYMVPGMAPLQTNGKPMQRLQTTGLPSPGGGPLSAGAGLSGGYGMRVYYQYPTTPTSPQQYFTYGAVNNMEEPKVKFPVHRLSYRVPIPVDVGESLAGLYQMIQVKKYSTAAIDPVRNFLTVYEYPIENQWVVWDFESGFVHLTGLWKAAEIVTNKIEPANGFSKSKTDIVKLLDSTPKKYHEYIKRIRGGFLKIQGTWLPHSLCRILARRFCYYLRYQLIPIFGEDFPAYCLKPTDPHFGELRFDDEELGYDVLEASHCLQTLGEYDAPQTPRQISNFQFQTPESPKKRKLDGINSILEAAEISELAPTISQLAPRDAEQALVPRPMATPKLDVPARRISIKINDLLT